MLNTKIPFKLREQITRLNWTWVIIGTLGLGLILTLAVSPSTSRHLKASLLGKDRNAPIGAFPVVVPTIKYGFALDTFQVFESEFQSSENLRDILVSQNMDYADIDNLVRNRRDVFDVRLTQKNTLSREKTVICRTFYRIIARKQPKKTVKTDTKPSLTVS